MFVAHSTSSVMISRRRSGPTAVAMSMECTTSANRTVTCLYSAGFETLLTAAPHSSQNFAVGRSSTLQALQAVIASPRPSPCDPRSRAPWPAGSTRSVRHRQHRTGRPRAARPHTPGMSLRPSSVNPRCPAALRIGVENAVRTVIDVRLWLPAIPPACRRNAWSERGWSTAAAGRRDPVKRGPIG